MTLCKILLLLSSLRVAVVVDVAAAVAREKIFPKTYTYVLKRCIHLWQKTILYFNHNKRQNQTERVNKAFPEEFAFLLNFSF